MTQLHHPIVLEEKENLLCGSKGTTVKGECGRFERVTFGHDPDQPTHLDRLTFEIERDKPKDKHSRVGQFMEWLDMVVISGKRLLLDELLVVGMQVPDLHSKKLTMPG